MLYDSRMHKGYLVTIGALVAITLVFMPRGFCQSDELKARRVQEDLLKAARNNLRNHDLDEAIAGFGALLQRDKSEVPVDLRAIALQGLVEAQSERRLQQSSPFPALKLLWSTYVLPRIGLLLVLVFGLLVYLLRRIPGGRIAIVFEDLPSVSANPIDASTRSDRNRALTSSVLELLETPQPLGISDLHMDIMPGTNEPGFGGLRPTQDTSVISDFVPSDHQMKIASVEFNLHDIFGYVAQLFRVPPRTIRGWIRDVPDGCRGFAQLLSRSRKPVPGHIWQAAATGKNARDLVVSDLAAQIIVHLKKTHLTRDWQSFRAFNEGIRKLRLDIRSGPASCDAREAQRCFEQALAYDAANWIARFQLALVLCRDGQLEVALRHFELLCSVMEGVLRRSIGRLPLMLRGLTAWAHRHRSRRDEPESCDANESTLAIAEHLRMYPECPFVVIYNEALALSDFRDGAHCADAVKQLDALANLAVKGDSMFSKYSHCLRRLSSRSAGELRLYSLSAQANILASRYVSDGANPNCDKGALKNTQRQVEELVADIEKACHERRQEHWRSLQTTRAVALSAYARILESDGDTSSAQETLYKALAAEPSLVDAHLQLAELFVRHKRSLADDWAIRAESSLLRATELNPSCERAQFLRAEIYADAVIDRMSEAKLVLSELTSYDRSKAAAYLGLAKLVLLGDKTGEATVEALDYLDRHIHISGTFSEDAETVFEQIVDGPIASDVLSRQLSHLLDVLGRVGGAAPSARVDERRRIEEAISTVYELRERE